MSVTKLAFNSSPVTSLIYTIHQSTNRSICAKVLYVDKLKAILKLIQLIR